MAKIYKGKNVVMIGNIHCGDNCSFWHNAVIRGDSDCITIGEKTNIQDLVMIHTGFYNNPVRIGKRVTIGHSAIIHGCTIEDDCLIGMGAIIMNGAIIKKHCIVGAGSLVTEGKIFEENSLILGSPAKCIRKLTHDEIENIEKNAMLYVEKAKKELEEDIWQ